MILVTDMMPCIRVRTTCTSPAGTGSRPESALFPTPDGAALVITHYQHIAVIRDLSGKVGIHAVLRHLRSDDVDLVALGEGHFHIFQESFGRYLYLQQALVRSKHQVRALVLAARAGYLP